MFSCELIPDVAAVRKVDVGEWESTFYPLASWPMTVNDTVPAATTACQHPHRTPAVRGSGSVLLAILSNNVSTNLLPLSAGHSYLGHLKINS